MTYLKSGDEPVRILTNAPKRWLRFDITHDGDEWSYLEAELNVFNWDYEHLVAAIVRTKYSQSDVEAIVLNDNADDLSELNAWRNHAKEIAEAVLGFDQTIDGARHAKLRSIEAYDSSPAVNSFLLNGSPVWLDKATRVGLVNSTNMLKQAGHTTTTLWLGTQQLTLPCDTALSMLCALELYALECYNVTAQHKANILSMYTIEEIDAYDHTTGYPQKLSL